MKRFIADKSRLLRSKGYTLVELITAFALTAILLTAVAAPLSTYIKVFAKINDTSIARTLMDTLKETVAGTISSAQDSRISDDDDRYECMLITTDANGMSKVEYRDKNGYPMELYIDTDTHYIVIRYLEVKNATGNVQRSEVLWGLGAGVYEGYTIETFTLTRVKENILSMELTIVNTRTESRYTTTSSIECYNLTENDIVIV